VALDRSVSRRRVLIGCVALFTPRLDRHARAAPANEIRIAFIGDSMSDGYWGGVVRATAKENCQKFAFGRYGENGSGLTRQDKFNWVEEAKSVVADFHPDLVVVSLGLNDVQSIVDANRIRTSFGSPAWSKKYREMVTTLLESLSTVPAGILWIGNPILRDSPANSAAQERNNIVAEAIGIFGPPARYVKPWQLYESGEDTFQAYGPDASGSRVQLRASDGVHFTTIGYDVVAAYLLPIFIDQLQKNEFEVVFPCPK
jgi:uncharacterized protein